MSANPVSKTHIDALVYAYFTWVEDAVNVPYMSPERAAKRRSLWSEANKIGQNLWLLNIQRTTTGWEEEGEEEAAERAMLMQQVRHYQFEPFTGTPQLADLLVLIDYWRYQTLSDEDEDPEGPAVMKSIDRVRAYVAFDFLQVHGRPYEQGDSTLPWGLEDGHRTVFVGKTGGPRPNPDGGSQPQPLPGRPSQET